jgi:methionine-rich copper-binding protein CopC
VTDSVKRVFGDEDTDNFSATSWFSQVQVPSVAAPSALALSSSDPVDNETGVVVSKTITLTFNNALPAAEIYHVVVSQADGTLVACTNSLDVTKKIMTVNPDSNMAASTVHIVAIGVSDIYGQDLQVVVNFTTA